MVFRRRFFYMLFFLFIYILGRNIPLPFVDIQKLAEGTNNSLFYLSITSGGDLSTMSIFALGLGPMISTTIIWRFLVLSELIDEKKHPKKQITLWKIEMGAVIAIIQAFGVISLLKKSIVVPENLNEIFVYILIIISLLLGTIIMTWIADLNKKKGIGEMSIFIVTGIFISIWPNIYIMSLIYKAKETALIYKMIRILIAISVLVVPVSFIFDRLESKYPLNRILINNELKGDSYIPLKYNPSGGMPIMFATTIFSLPQYFLMALNLFDSDRNILKYWNENFTLYQTNGIILYCVILAVMSIGFGYMQINPDEIANNFKKSATYIDYIPIAKPTYKFLKRKVNTHSIIGMIFIVTTAGLPMFLGKYFGKNFIVATVPGTLIMLTLIITKIFEEIKKYKVEDRYREIFDTKRKFFTKKKVF